jgi:Glycosyl hydrolases family 16
VQGPLTIEERFTGGRLDETVWTPAYLPAWSSTREAAATYEVVAEGLRLTIPPEQPLWCPDLHDEPLRVSAIQSGTWSGPAGSTRGQQPFRDGLVVREPQIARWGFTPHHGHVEVECRATLTERSMFSAWMVGLEVEADDCGEICLVEVFGDTLAGGRVAAVGHGIKRIRDPRLRQDFVAQPRPIDITEAHVYAVDWRPGEVDFLLDGERLRTVSQAPTYPMQLIIGVFDFPGRAGSERDDVPIPVLIVRRVSGRTHTRPQ